MKLFRILLLVLCFGAVLPMQQSFAGGAKSASVFPRNLSVEELAKMVYEAAKNDPANAAIIFMDALASRDTWSAVELRFVVDALLVAVPDMPVAELPSIIGGVDLSDELIQQVVEQVSSESALPQSPVVEPQAPSLPVYPVVPSPDDISGVK